ncbi:MAG: hypothetical protein LBN28_06230, partial [Desulfovibrio sp.]|nr:hypothetical protein [Desulfovibrio sp.]
ADAAQKPDKRQKEVGMVILNQHDVLYTFKNDVGKHVQTCCRRFPASRREVFIVDKPVCIIG